MHTYISACIHTHIHAYIYAYEHRRGLSSVGSELRAISYLLTYVLTYLRTQERPVVSRERAEGKYAGGTYLASKVSK